MFRINIEIRSLNIYGCNALDFCRSKGLPDHSPARIGHSSITADVGEDFARAYFPPDSNNCSEIVTAAMLIPGDLTTDDDDDFILDPAMSPERVCSLFLGARMARIIRDSPKP